MSSEARAIYLPIAILGVLIAGLCLAYWQDTSGGNAAPNGAEGEQACPGCESEGESEVPAAGLLSVVAEIPPFTFTNQDGERMGRDDLIGKIWIADFIYVKCAGPCPAMTVNMKQLQDLGGEMANVQFVTFTVDPDRDSIADLKTYATNTDADPERWNFLRGERDELRDLMIKGFLIGDPSEPLNHSTRFCLVDQTGRLRGHYDYKRADEMLRLRKHVRLLATGERL